MIRLNSVTKCYGAQILFVDASCALFRGDKVGLVGPNGSGKILGAGSRTLKAPRYS